MKKYLIGMLLGACGLASAAPASEYYSIPGKHAGGRIDPEAKAVSAGDRENPAQFCDRRSGFHCFRAEPFVFGAPTTKSLPASWTVQGTRFLRRPKSGF